MTYVRMILVVYAPPPINEPSLYPLWAIRSIVDMAGTWSTTVDCGQYKSERMATDCGNYVVPSLQYGP